jgi:hypothetical protein
VGLFSPFVIEHLLATLKSGEQSIHTTVRSFIVELLAPPTHSHERGRKGTVVLTFCGVWCVNLCGKLGCRVQLSFFYLCLCLFRSTSRIASVLVAS